MAVSLLRANWPAPKQIHALTTTRLGGCSQAPYDEMNLALHVGDAPAAVEQNRQALMQMLGITQPIQWLEQVHGTDLVKAAPCQPSPQADACWSDTPGQVCAVMTADCLPVLFTDRQGSRVAAAHAGWRGLAAGMLEKTLSVFPDPNDVLVWMGPAIGPLAFEVGPEVYQAFCDEQPEAILAFRTSPTDAHRWLADLYQLARLRLSRAGVDQVYGGDYCTFTDQTHFYSYRRAAQTGRMASLIWIAEN
ncbi:peptidoglycan editing factor PgeF [Nitrincola tapanii]|uniref:Purine nucleoside phosphorylase n=1 Tax=Nitrincola tapanii TaxID=1708751 RepID=A0A5A9W7A9_9GAMM|nr:peptidoglycan editing factor PgeF [Nitrincola tapanii]KAA0876344.1 peptidoglycan editing factor PgeF [Nitrincola tapanii]